MERSNLRGIQLLRNLLFLVIVFVEVFLAFHVFAASFTDSVLIGGSGPADSKSQLDVKSTTKGVLLPRMTNTQRDAITSPTTGLIIFSSTDGTYEFYNGSSWASLGGITGTLGASQGGTGQSSYTIGDTLYASGTTALSKLAGNTATTKKFLSQTGNGSVSAAPAWAQPTCSDISGAAASCATDATNAANISSGVLPIARGGTNNGGLSVSAGAMPYFTGTAFGSLAPGSAGQVLLSQGTTAPAWTSATYPSSAALGDVPIGSAANTISMLSGNTTTTKKFLSQTGNGSVSASPAWGQPAFSDITGTASLTSQVTGTLPVANGGTGLATLTAHSLQVGNGTSAVTQIAVPASGTVLTGVASSDPAFSATPTLGVAGTTLGTLSLAGNTSGTIAIKPQAAAGTYNFNLPTTAGGAGQVLTSQGGGTSAMTWSSILANPATAAFDTLYQNSGNTALTNLPNGTTGQVYKATTSAAPSWGDPSVISRNSSSTTYNAQVIERATITNNGTTCSVTTQSGSWISSLGRPGTGRCNIVIASGIFSGAPSCICSVQLSATGGECNTDNSGTLSSTSWYFVTSTNVGVTTNATFDVICMGAQ